ncbi:hypothetical protein MVES_003280 [Malassezia vespertilionis]|uniref:Uncharacterized protein n=1 Tax=Malassezia vespertilionis TaxID=2020962 RepID=A0A2N1J8E5_9BASI|nr:hypothetical protein MVES_003280 [Malassezia vespertilionis]
MASAVTSSADKGVTQDAEHAHLCSANHVAIIGNTSDTTKPGSRERTPTQRLEQVPRKCEYERVSEHDNLLSRERKRLSRERKAARVAANGPGRHASPLEEKIAAGSVSPIQASSTSSSKSQTPPFPIPTAPLGMETSTNAADMCTIVPTGDQTISPAWATTQGFNPKDMAPWMVQPAATTTLNSTITTHGFAANQDTLNTLRSVADPSLLEVSAPPAPSSLSSDSPSLMSMAWTDSDKQSESPCESNFLPHHLTDFSSALQAMVNGPLGTASPAVDSMELNSAIDTPLKLFSDVQQLPSLVDSASPSEGSNALSESTPSALNSSNAISPLSPRLAPSAFEDFDSRGLAGFGTPEVQHLGLYSSSLPLQDSNFAYGADLEASSMPAYASPWKQLTSN